jgi:hypothetical protein
MQLKTKILVKGLIAAVVAIGLLFTLLASGAIISSETIASSGIIATANIGVYSDTAGTQSLTSINGGTGSPCGIVSQTVYFKNIGTTQVTLSMTGANWSPASPNGPLTLTWNREGTALGANQVATTTRAIAQQF